MAFELISLSPEVLLNTLKSVAEPLLYPSDTDAPLEIQLLTVAEVGEAISAEDIQRVFYDEGADFEVGSIEWAEANRLESNGTQRFFLDLPDIITTYPNNEYQVQEQYHREHAQHWRTLRDLFFDNLVKQRWFRVDLAEPDSARADIYLVGRHLKIEVDPETEETRTELLDWVVIKTYVIEA
ncbi:MAG: hypothetical protein WCR52_20080 [Bacteroidota bacterium]